MGYNKQLKDTEKTNVKAYTLREATKIIDDLKERVEALEARLGTY